jgi:hypothetical protein
MALCVCVCFSRWKLEGGGGESKKQRGKLKSVGLREE